MNKKKPPILKLSKISAKISGLPDNLKKNAGILLVIAAFFAGYFTFRAGWGVAECLIVLLLVIAGLLPLYVYSRFGGK
ncbi:hypothetical protein FACS189499_00890 [Clostridia bacterium]|nr:hypothetical protein FACS189499_00890 [Clostridia bacterium]